MKKFLIATTALASVAVVAPANAADLPVKAPPMVMPALYNWSGIYIGVEGGAVLGQTTKWFVHETDTTFEVSQDLGHPLHGGRGSSRGRGLRLRHPLRRRGRDLGGSPGHAPGPSVGRLL